MGHPNWQRLAELGQLPDYMKDVLPANYSEANENSRRARGQEPNKELEENENIKSIISDAVEEVDEAREELLRKTNSELRDILKENGLDDSYAKNADLIERILNPEVKKEEEAVVEEEKIEEKVEEKKNDEEKVGEFVDELLN